MTTLHDLLRVQRHPLVQVIPFRSSGQKVSVFPRRVVVAQPESMLKLTWCEVRLLEGESEEEKRRRPGLKKEWVSRAEGLSCLTETLAAQPEQMLSRGGANDVDAVDPEDARIEASETQLVE